MVVIIKLMKQSYSILTWDCNLWLNKWLKHFQLICTSLSGVTGQNGAERSTFSWIFKGLTSSSVAVLCCVVVTLDLLLHVFLAVEGWWPKRPSFSSSQFSWVSAMDTTPEAITKRLLTSLSQTCFTVVLIHVVVIMFPFIVYSLFFIFDSNFPTSTVRPPPFQCCWTRTVWWMVCNIVWGMGGAYFCQ